MKKKILITGATDGIGLETARSLVSLGHHVLLHGRNPAKVQAVASTLSGLSDGAQIDAFVADLSRIEDVQRLSAEVTAKYEAIDVLINNAGVYRATTTTTEDGWELRFSVNTFAPYFLTKRLLPLLGPSARVLNVSSAAQSPVDMAALMGDAHLSDGQAYAQSKLALTMWSSHMGRALAETGPVIVAINPGSMLGSKMVQEAFGVDGGDIGIGADILCRGATSEEFANASGQYFDNDAGCFASPHPDALNADKTAHITQRIEEILATRLGLSAL